MLHLSLAFADVFPFSIMGMDGSYCITFFAVFLKYQLYNIFYIDTVSAFNETNLSHRIVSESLLIQAYSYI